MGTILKNLLCPKPGFLILQQLLHFTVVLVGQLQLIRSKNLLLIIPLLQGQLVRLYLFPQQLLHLIRSHVRTVYTIYRGFRIKMPLKIQRHHHISSDNQNCQHSQQN